MKSKESKKRLAICDNKGFHMRFENGWTISVQFGAGSYCDNYSASIKDYGKKPSQSNNAEVWCWDESGNKKYPEEPTNRSSPEEILKIMNHISNIKEVSKK